MKTKKGPIICILILFICVVHKNTIGQSLCENPNFAKGDFDLNHETLCGLTELKAINKSAATDLKYYFNYKGEDLLEAQDSSKVQTQHIYPLQYQPQIYTVLQIGTLSGKTSIACRNVTVRSNNVPSHSFAICGRDLELAIPASSLNNFDAYRVIISGVVNPINFTSRDIPIKILRNITLPASYSITGIYNDPSKNCSNNTFQQLIPRETLITNYPNTPNINRLELINLKTAKLNYSGPYKIDNTSSYRLMMYEKNKYGSAWDIVKDINPGTYEIPIPDSTKSYCFIARKNQSCGGLFEESAEICTIPIYSSIYDPNKNELILSWVPYPQTHKGFPLPPFGSLAVSTISFNQIIQIKTASLNLSSFQLSANQSEYLQTNINCTTNIDYRIKQQTNGTFRFKRFVGISLSNRIIFDAQKIKPPALEQVWASTNTSNINEIKFVDNPNKWPIQKLQWYLHKDVLDKFEIIDSVSAGNNLIDKTIAIKPESYRISYKDICQRNSEISDTVNTIFIKRENLEKVSWNKAVPFSNQNIEETIIRNLDRDLKTELKKENQNLNILESNINYFEGDDDIRLQILSSGGDKVSTSNILIIPKPLDIFIPSIITPNNDGINDGIELKGNIKNINSMDFQLFNRFGELVIQANSTEALKQLSEKLNLLPTPNLYGYKLKIIYNNNIIKTIDGKIYCLYK